MISVFRLSLFACAVTLYAGEAASVPITVSNAGYWLETVGTNTIGIANGGSAQGISTALFVANTTPDTTGGTTATATQNGVAAGAVGVDGVLWARRVLNPTATQLTPLTVTFTNGADQAAFTGRDLTGLSAMPLVGNLQVSNTGNAFIPSVAWALPTAAGAGDVDFVQLVFYNNATDAEIGTRVTLASTATSYQLTTTLPANFDLVVNVRLIDLYDDNAAFVSGNIQRESRAYANYITPIPETGTAVMTLLGLAVLSWRARPRRDS